MNARDFLDAAYALLAQNTLRLGADLDELLESLKPWVRPFREIPPEQIVAPEARGNDASLAAFEKMMMGVST
jgi:hypothetical protein